VGERKRRQEAYDAKAAKQAAECHRFQRAGRVSRKLREKNTRASVLANRTVLGRNVLGNTATRGNKMYECYVSGKNEAVVQVGEYEHALVACMVAELLCPDDEVALNDISTDNPECLASNAGMSEALYTGENYPELL